MLYEVITNVGVNYSNSSNYIQETQVNTLGQYFMLKFVYNLSGLARNGINIERVGH